MFSDRFSSSTSCSGWLHGIGRAVGHSGAPPFFMFVPESVKVLHEEMLGEEMRTAE